MADAETLLPNGRMREGAVAGDVTQIHRGDQYADEGDRFEVEDETFEVVEVRERTLGDLTDEDAQAEGMADLEQYREVLDRAHENFEWDDDSDVVLHRFEKVA
ncbi:ASCH domain-containing protein [Halorussus salilacus]|uniref:ASCH domain-containing protein n=1 Tax=Halorussus salilacus TaxID=2953750 RepID=UPI00209E12C6|nr:ASCH domain-containing protein [Halorussus salilacus]USZ69303.1 ASCH domain-containing protein [Halorussus salilacus]